MRLAAYSIPPAICRAAWSIPWPATSTSSRYSRPQAMRSSRIPKIVTPRMSSRVPSPRVPCQCHSAHQVSPSCADRSSSAWKSGTPAKTSPSSVAPARSRRTPGRDAPAARFGSRGRSRRRRRPGRGGSGVAELLKHLGRHVSSPQVRLACGQPHDGPVEPSMKDPAPRRAARKPVVHARYTRSRQIGERNGHERHCRSRGTPGQRPEPATSSSTLGADRSSSLPTTLRRLPPSSAVPVTG
jgi:hypothetical protein